MSTIFTGTPNSTRSKPGFGRLAATALAVVFLSASLWPAAGGARKPAAPSSDLHNVPMRYSPRVEKLDDRYRLTLQASEALPHYLIEKTPEKIWLRLARPSSNGSQVLEGDSVIRAIRLVSRAYSADMILDLGPDAVSNDVYFDNGKKTLVVDVFTSAHISKEKPVQAAAPVMKPEPVFVEKPAAKKMAPAATSARQRLTIVVDAGHGGFDSGAIGTRGTLEKDINLEVARSLADQLSKERDVRVLMTRDKDEFITLNHRTEIANKANADLFVSIHCNSSLSPRHIGFETYFLSPDATDKAAESVARVENSVVVLETNKGEASTRLGEVLASMAIGTYINESSKFASLVCRNIRSRTSQDKTEVKEADFYVLRGAQMPAVLIELEYLSNPLSELKLRSSRYRSQIVKAVSEGIKAYERQAKQEQDAMASQLDQAPNLTTR